MALFTRVTKTLITSRKCLLTRIKIFITLVSEGSEPAITIKMQDIENQKTYSVSLYGPELEQLKNILNHAPV